VRVNSRIGLLHSAAAAASLIDRRSIPSLAFSYLLLSRYQAIPNDIKYNTQEAGVKVLAFDELAEFIC
jgi:hypothetical protein